MRKNSCDDATLRDDRDAAITIECDACDRRSDLDRKALIKQYGATLSFRQLRRRLTVGCSRMNSIDGIDRCQACFPCLDADAENAR
jgi:hypothetical protein